jgi:septal ring factor EnvC (AmiA/AmiB activator)
MSHPLIPQTASRLQKCYLILNHALTSIQSNTKELPMPINTLYLLLLIPLFITLSSCSAPGKQAKDSNLFDAMINNSSGESDNQQKIAEMKREKSRKELKEALEKSKNLEQQLESTKHTKKQGDEQLALLQQENAALEIEIQNQKSLNQQQEATKQQRLTKIRKVNAAITTLKKAKRTLPAPQYNQQLIQLQKEVKILRQVMANQ